MEVLRQPDGLRHVGLPQLAGVHAVHLRRGVLWYGRRPRAREGWHVGGARLAADPRLQNTDPSAPLVGVEQVCKAHWAEFGRNYYARYDYEGVEKEAAEKMMAAMVEAQPALIGTTVAGMKIAKADMFEYHDPVDGSVSKNQGVRFIFEDGSRFVFRLSGTGVAGATIRMYLEKYAAPTEDLALDAFDVVKPIADIALAISKLTEFTGRTEPTVIT